MRTHNPRSFGGGNLASSMWTRGNQTYTQLSWTASARASGIVFPRSTASALWIGSGKVDSSILRETSAARGDPEELPIFHRKIDLILRLELHNRAAALVV